MKNYYEILQVSPHASDDIIEKAYKVLAKKYHPDLQKSLSNKSYAEQRLKEINEAYNVLKDEFLREQYDFELKKEQDNIFNEEIRKRSLNKNDNQENEKPKKQKYEETNNYENPDSYRNNDINHRQEFSRYEYAKMRKQEIEAEEYKNMDAFGKLLYTFKKMFRDIPKGKDLKNIGRKDVFAVVLTIIIVIIIGVILWFIPFTNPWMRELLFENPLFSWIGNLINN